MRRVVATVVGVHGAIHLLGVADGFGWAEIDQFARPISPPMGILWLVAAVAVIGAAVSLAIGVDRWWMLGAIAVALSQVAIVTSWGDAWAGTAGNAVLATAVVHGWAAHGPRSLRARYRRHAAAILAPAASADSVASPAVTGADLDRVPAPVARYLRRCGVVGRPRPRALRAAFHGRIRSGPDDPWMPFVGQQTNSFGSLPDRVFFMDATKSGMPVDVLHVFAGERATMRAKVASLVTVVDVDGPEMDRAETVTVLNDMCLLAPASLLGADVTWESIDDRRTRVVFRRGAHTVTAELVFDDDGDLVDFVSNDRSRASGDRFVDCRWSTPISGYAEFRGRRVVATGEGRWHPPEGDATYLEFHLDDVIVIPAS